MTTPQPKFDVTTVGEAMLRLSVPVGYRLEMASRMDTAPAGAEANMVVALSRLGRRCAWLGGLPDSPLGRLVTNQLRIAGVDMAGVIWDKEGRLGTYFVEFAEPPRPIQVIYDRANSVAARVTPQQINWDYMLDTRLIHLTGITPAVSASCMAVVTETVARAKEAGVALSFDINYRGKLWSPQEAKAGLLPLIQNVDLLLCGQGDARLIFGCDGSPQQIVEGLAEQSQAQRIVVTLGNQGVIGWDGSSYYEADALPVEVIDRIGAGDALAAGVIHGLLDNDLPQGLRYGTALAALVLSQHGDMLVTTEEEMLAVLADAGGGVNR